MVEIVPKPTLSLQATYKDYCVKQNLTLVGYFSMVAIVVFGLHLIHHLRLGMGIFSASMIPYTLLYTFNVIYAIVNLLVLPKMRDVKALQGLAVLLQVAYPFFMGLVFTLLGIVGVIQEGGPVPFVAGMLVIAVILQGHYLALLLLLAGCWVLLSLGIIVNLPVEQATPPIMICFTVVVASALIARLTEKARIEQFEVIEELHQKNKLLLEISHSDPLTQLCNRKHFYTVLDNEVARAMRYNHPLGLLLINIDDFKQINQDLGHDSADEVLLTIANLIKQQQREIDLVCRYHSDKFAVLLVETNTEQSIEVAQRIRLLVEKHDFCLNGAGVTVSVGHTQYRGQPVSKFVESADNMLVESKRLGKNRVSSDST